MNLAYFLNSKRPYTTYFIGYITNFISGILVMIGHETMASKYQNKNKAAAAVVTQFTLGTFALGISILAVMDYNMNLFYNFKNFSNIVLYPTYLSLIAVGMLLGILYDNDFSKRRRRFIGLIKRVNAKIEYKTKALNSYKAYLRTGNAEKFLEDNVELLERTLVNDRERLK